MDVLEALKTLTKAVNNMKYRNREARRRKNVAGIIAGICNTNKVLSIVSKTILWIIIYILAMKIVNMLIEDGVIEIAMQKEVLQTIELLLNGNKGQSREARYEIEWEIKYAIIPSVIYFFM